MVVASNVPLEKLQEQRQQLVTALEIKALEGQIAMMSGVTEAYDQWGFWEPTPDAEGIYSQGVRMDAYPETRLWDNTEGRAIPLYEYDRDIRVQRKRVRSLQAMTAMYYGASEALNTYTMGTNWEYTVQTEEGYSPPDGLEAELQNVVDEFIKINNFVNQLDGELHDDARLDGDTFLGLYPAGNGQTHAIPINADNCWEPSDKDAIDRWLGVDDMETCWNFGVHAYRDPDTHMINYDQPLGYSFVFDDAMRDWDYLPSWPSQQLESFKCCHQIKRNVPRFTAARGYSDWSPIYEDLVDEAKLARNLRVGVALQAAISWIEEEAEGTTEEQSASMMGSNLMRRYERLKKAVNSTGGTSNYAMRMDPGTVVKTSNGRKYHEAPISTKSSVAMEVARFAMSRFGVRWNFPDFMISGNASSAALASTLVAESPFVLAREKDQRGFAVDFRQIMWKVLRIAFLSGRFDKFGKFEWRHLREAFDIDVRPPSVAKRDGLREAQENKIWMELGVKDPVDIAAEQDFDPDKVEELQARRDQQQERMAAASPFGNGGFGNGGPPEAADPSSDPSADPNVNHAETGMQATAESIQRTTAELVWGEYP